MEFTDWCSKIQIFANKNIRISGQSFCLPRKNSAVNCLDAKFHIKVNRWKIKMFKSHRIFIYVTFTWTGVLKKVSILVGKITLCPIVRSQQNSLHVILSIFEKTVSKRVRVLKQDARQLWTFEKSRVFEHTYLSL